MSPVNGYQEFVSAAIQNAEVRYWDLMGSFH